MEREINYDLHGHTICSDGTFTVREFLERAKANGLKGVAITDHDTMSGIGEGREIAKEIGIDFISGIEFSCFIGDNEIHILGYFLDENMKEMKEKLTLLKEERDKRNRKILEKLEKVGLPLTMEEVEAEATGQIISKVHICNAMIKKGYIYTKSEGFRQYLGTNKVAHVQKGESNPMEMVKLIKRCGGVAVLAHPKLVSSSKERVLEILELLIEVGLDGIEAEYPAHSKEEREYFRKVANEKGLVITGGSDFHGGNREGIDLGAAGITENEFKIMKDILKED